MAVTRFGMPTPGCLDHDKNGRSRVVRLARAKCNECKLIAKWWADPNYDFSIPQTQGNKGRSYNRQVEVESFVGVAAEKDDWVLARMCEQILARHLGPTIEIRPLAGEQTTSYSSVL